MSLVEIGDDLWTGAAIKSMFKIIIPDNAQSNIEGGPTIICGLGWRFSCSASTQSSNQATVFVGADGETLPTWRISVFFDPHLISSAAYGSLSFSIAIQHLFILKDATPCAAFTLPYQNYYGQSNTQIGTYIYTPGLKMVPTIAISVIIPAQTGLSIPRSIDGKLARLLADTMSGKPAVDVKFYAFTRKNSRYVTHPQSIFARSELLEGFSDELDLMISGGGFGEAKLVDLDRHRIDKERVEDYDYMSDSDLDSDDEAIEDNGYVDRPIPSDTSDTSFVTREPSDVPLPPSRTASPSGRMGRAVTLNGTAFKTWQALLYYLYTSKLPFSAPQPVTEVSEPPLAVPVSKGKTGLGTKGKKKATAKDASAPLPKGHRSTPQYSGSAQCSAKSMYRLADKLGLDDLKAVSLSSIKANLTTKNIIREVFSDFTSRYSEVQDIEVEFVLKNFPVLKDEINKILDETCQGYRPHCLDVLQKIVAGRNC